MNSRSWSHNPTPQPLGHGHIWCLRERSNLRDWLFRPALVHLSYTGKSLVDTERIELSSSRCKREVLPLNDVPTNLVPAVGIEPTPSALSERRPPGEPGRFGGQRENRPRFTALQVRRIASNACRPNLEPTLRIGLRSHAYHACALPLSYEGWSRRADLNRCLSFTRARFFPIELLRLERIIGLEPMYADWQPAVLAAGRNPQIWSGM